MVQVQDAGGEGERATQFHIGRELRAAVKGIERSAAFQVVHVGQVRGHGMPGLADGEGQRAVVPVQLHVCLTQTKDGNRTAEVVEIGLHLAGDAHGANLIGRYIQAQAGGEGNETPVETAVHVHTVLHVMTLGHIEIQVLCTGVDGTGIGGDVVADKSV